MAPKNKRKSAPASTAAAPALSLQKVALVVLTTLLCLSLATKVQGLSPLYGPNKLYAGGLLPLSEVYEIGTLALLYVDRPIGVIALFAYIGDAPSAGSWPWPRKLVMTPTCRGGFAAVLRRFCGAERARLGRRASVPVARAYRPHRHSAQLPHSGGTAHALAFADASPEASGAGSGHGSG